MVKKNKEQPLKQPTTAEKKAIQEQIDKICKTE